MPKPSKQSKKSSKRSFKVPTFIRKPYAAIVRRVKAFMARRPHRSFRLTKRRDYKRSLELPGYFRFTGEVNKTLLAHKKIFIWLAVSYVALSAALVGIGSQESYASLTSTLQETSTGIFQGNFAELGKAGLLFATIMTSGITTSSTESQQIYAVILGLLVWLATVWLLRNLLAGHKVKVRDGLYSSAAPIVPMFLVFLVLILQLIPFGLALIGYAAAVATGLLSGGVEAMLFWIGAGFLIILSMYWITSTFFAMIIVTLPGMYPMRALRTAGDMMVGRRIRILLRLLWMFATLVISWAIILIPIILLDGFLKGLTPQIAWVPIIPAVLLVLGVVTFIWASAYVYLLYRKVVDDDAKPAL